MRSFTLAACLSLILVAPALADAAQQRHVGPSAEAAPGSRQHDAAHRIVGAERRERLRELVIHLVRQRVQLLRPVELHRCDGGLAQYLQAHQLVFMFAAFTRFDHLSISDLMNARNSSGLLPTGSAPWLDSARTMSQRAGHPLEGYLAFAAIVLYLIGIALLPSASWQMVRVGRKELTA